ncbi:hypothetical protein GGS20DRAFT_593439 [Poronia punctata]|nr:hypothetical protein GGS20DRAFT_593439 [Poronia punctata]
MDIPLTRLGTDIGNSDNLQYDGSFLRTHLESSSPHTSITGLPDSLSQLANSAIDDNTCQDLPVHHTLGDDPELGSQKPTVALSPWQSIGRLNAYIIIFGTIGPICTLGFLTFLWAGQGKDPEGQSAGYVWRTIMLSNRLDQLVTISGLIFRESIFMQTTICTSLVAALMLERRSIPISQSVPLSVLRSVNSGPHTLVKLLLGRKPWKCIFYPELSLILLLSFGNIAIRFSSTILLSDLHQQPLAGFPCQLTKNLSVPPENWFFFGLWSRPPRDVPIFGEVQSEYAAKPNNFGLSDTGLKRYAMLPFNTGRETIRSYEGPAMVLSSRVACMPPKLLAKVEFEADAAVPTIRQRVTGDILIEETLKRSGLSYQGMCDLDHCLPRVSFNCYLASPLTHGDSLGITFCPLRSIHPKQVIVESRWEITKEPWSLPADIYLVSSTNISREDWEELGHASTQLQGYHTKDEWSSFDLGSGRVINLTVCFNAANVMLSSVSMQRSQKVTEPSIIARDGQFDTTHVRKFLGADPETQSLEERGVLSITNITDPPDHVFTGGPAQIPVSQVGATQLRIAPRNPSTANTTYAGCDRCEYFGNDIAHEYSGVFFDILINSGRVSVALQTVHTMLAGSVYHQLSDYLTIPMSVTVVQTSSSTVPVYYSGLIAVAILVLANTGCVLAITAMYLHYSRYSIIGNFWHAVSQGISDLTSALLVYGNMEEDRKIFLDGREQDLTVRLARSVVTDRVELVECEPLRDPGPAREERSRRTETTPRINMKRLRKRMVVKRRHNATER